MENSSLKKYREEKIKKLELSNASLQTAMNYSLAIGVGIIVLSVILSIILQSPLPVLLSLVLLVAGLGLEYDWKKSIKDNNAQIDLLRLARYDEPLNFEEAKILLAEKEAADGK